MEKTLEMAPPSVLFRALLGACEVPGEALQKPLSWEVSYLPCSQPSCLISHSVAILTDMPTTFQPTADRQTDRQSS